MNTEIVASTVIIQISDSCEDHPLPSGKGIYIAMQKKAVQNSYVTINHSNLYTNPNIQAVRWTHPNVFITLYELWMSKETSLQDRFHQCEVHHVQKKQAQNRQVYDDCNLHNTNTIYARVVPLSPQSLKRLQGLKEQYRKSLWWACCPLVASPDDLKPMNREEPSIYYTGITVLGQTDKVAWNKASLNEALLKSCVIT